MTKDCDDRRSDGGKSIQGARQREGMGCLDARMKEVLLDLTVSTLFAPKQELMPVREVLTGQLTGN